MIPQLKKYVNLIFIFFAFVLVSFKSLESAKQQFKYLIQMTDYSGEGAYVIASLINPNGDYEKTLYVHGQNKTWYHEIDLWWDFYGKKRPNIDAITGETIKGGQRDTGIITVESSKINSGYKIKFETSVEDQNYYPGDIEIELDTSRINKKIPGSGFIKYVKLIAM